MSRPKKETKKTFRVFCEGDTEYNYIEEFRKQKRIAISIKPVNMHGGGYRNFLDTLKTDSTVNCLAKFIIIDGDKAVTDETEKQNLKELLRYCILQNKSNRIPHFLIINSPDFEYVACLHTSKYRNQNVSQYIVKELGYKSLEDFKADEKVYNVLNTKGNSSDLMCSKLENMNKLIINIYSVKKSLYEIKVSETLCNCDNLGHKGSNINEFFEVVNKF